MHDAAGAADRLLPRLVRLSLVTFIFNLGAAIVAPALPLYARTLGADYRDLGLLGAAYGLAYTGLTVPLGRASDRLGRRILFLFSALTIAGATGCFMLARGVSGLILGKLLEAVGWAAFWPALQAWVAEQFGRRAGTAMGVGYGAYAASYVLGSAAAGLVMEAAGLRAPFGIYLGTTLVTLGLLLATPVQRVRPEPGQAEPAGPAGAGSASDGADRRQRSLAYGTGFVYVFALGTVLAFLPAYAADRGFSPRGVGLLLGAYWGGRVVVSCTVGRLSERWGRRLVLVSASLGTALAGVLVAAPFGPATLILGTLLLGIAAGACAPTCIGLIADHVAPADRGLAMGFFESACGAAFILSGFLGGQAAYALGPDVPYLLAAALAALWTPLLARRIAPGPAAPPAA